MAAKITDMQPVLPFHLLKDNVDSLNCENRPFLTYENGGVDS